MGCSPWGHKEVDTTKLPALSLFSQWDLILVFVFPAVSVSISCASNILFLLLWFCINSIV